MYDRVWNREKIIFKFPPFCKSNKENEKKRTFIIMLHLAKTKMHLFLFSFEFFAIEFQCSKLKKDSNFQKNFCSLP